ncbi:MAG: GspH/FimT family pseudopilin [Gammaproteobacteria bacterium]
MLKHDQGFTLVELMVTVAVLAISMSFAVPFMGDFIKNSRLVTQTNDLIASFQLARSEAIKRGARVTLCKSTDGVLCDPAADGRWDIGWITFVDTFVDPAVDIGIRDPGNPDETLIDTRAATPLNVAIAPQAPPDDVSVKDYVSYTAQGIVRDAAGAAQTGTFRICDDRGPTKGRGVVLWPTGRVELTTNIATCPS